MDFKQRLKAKYNVTAADHWHPADSLLGLDFQEVIDTVHANEKVRDEAAVLRTFENILNAQAKDARHALKAAMPKILEELKGDTTASADTELEPDDIPKDWPVQPLKPGQPAKDKATCGTCGLSWDDGKSTSMTPTPAARCPFEHFHIGEDD